MRILVLNWRDIRHPEAGGAEHYIHNMCTEFVRSGHDVCLYTSNFRGGLSEEVIDGIKIVRCGGRFSVYWSVYRTYLKEKNRFDVVFESINTIPFFARLYFGPEVVPLIYSINNSKAMLKELGITPISIVGWIGNSLVKSIYRRSVVVTISETSKKELIIAGFNPDSIFVAKPSVNPEFENLVEKIPESKRPNGRIIYLGRLKKYKRVDIILEAIAILKQSMPLELLVVGKGDFEGELQKMAANLGLTNNVKFTGFVTTREKITLLKNSSVFVCCSIDEGGWTIAGLEGLKCGVPLVVTNSQADLVIEGITGFITSPEPEIVAKKIKMVLEGDWKTMSTAALESSKAINWFDSAKMSLNGLHFAVAKHNKSSSLISEKKKKLAYNSRLRY